MTVLNHRGKIFSSATKQLYFPKLEKYGLENVQVPCEARLDLLLREIFESFAFQTLYTRSHIHVEGKKKAFSCELIIIKR